MSEYLHLSSGNDGIHSPADLSVFHGGTHGCHQSAEWQKSPLHEGRTTFKSVRVTIMGNCKAHGFKLLGRSFDS